MNTLNLKSVKQFLLFLLMLIPFLKTDAQIPIKRPLVEEYTGAWCASCGFGSVYFEYLAEEYPNAIPVAIHNGDVMQNLSMILYMTDYFSGSPTFLYDRVDFESNTGEAAAISAYPWPNGLDTLNKYLDIQYNQIPIATVGIDKTYNPDTRKMTATVTANFLEDAEGEFRLNCFVLEDSITGGTEYDQANSNFSDWTSGPEYLQALIDSPPVITNYYHNHVAREMLGTPAGADASIPENVPATTSYSKTFEYIIPEEYNENQISLVGLLQRYGGQTISNEHRIENAVSKHLLPRYGVGVTNDEAAILNVSIYPNPITNNASVEFYLKKNGRVSCELYDALGRRVKLIFNENFTQGEYKIPLGQLNLTTGIYLLKFNQNGLIQTKQICIR